ncbi:MAG: peptidylprolyl isomerase [Chitinophagales bacterium]|nr:peptidylprolyl isomerase [Chitinophagales bacterium]
MKGKLLTFIILLMCAFPSFVVLSQEKTLFTIGGEPVNVADFEYIYKKNNINNKADYSKASLQEYLDLYTNFKLKVKEAESEGMDKDPAILDELSSYENQLFDSWLDKKITDKLVQEAYDRSQYDVSVSHIFIACDKNRPEEIQSTKKSIEAIYSLLVDGANFEETAKTYSSDKTSREEGGYLGYYTALQINYKAFEDAAYNTAVGKFSKPFQTEMGWHIVKVNDKRPARGKIKVAIIKKLIPPFEEQQPLVEKQVDSIYNALKNGASFADLAKTLSDDQFTNYNGGQLDWFGISQYAQVFEDAAFGLQKNGDICAPFKTKTAWYIIQRLDRAGIPTYEDAKPNLYSKVKKSDRYANARYEMADSLYNAWHIKIDQVVFDSIKARTLVAFNNIPFTFPGSATETTLFKGDNGIDVSDNYFGRLMEGNFRFSKGLISESKFTELFKIAKGEMVMELLKKRLPTTDADYGHLVKEYKDGILLFDQMEKNVWSVAMQDTTGLKNYFNNNREKFKYADRANVATYQFEDEKSAKSFLKLAKKYPTVNDSTLLEKCKALNIQTTLKTETIEKNGTGMSNQIKWTKGFSAVIKNDNKFSVVRTNNILPARLKEFDEVKGFVVAAYQDEIEKKWIAALKKKYPVVVNQSVFEGLIKK